jgi:hypothetical protein
MAGIRAVPRIPAFFRDAETSVLSMTLFVESMHKAKFNLQNIFTRWFQHADSEPMPIHGLEIAAAPVL